MTIFDITLNSNPRELNNFVLNISVPDEGYTVSPEFNFMLTSDDPTDIVIQSTRQLSSVEMVNVLTDYFSTQSYITVTQKDNGAIISIDAVGEFSYSTDFSGGRITIAMSTSGSYLDVTGLEANGYLINNEIWLDISSAFSVSYFNISFKNNTNGNQSANFPSSSFNNSTRVNISPIIKSMFDYAGVRNDNNFTITITDSEGRSIGISKTFIRGGNRTQETNQSIQSGSILRPSVNLPVWDGFPTAEDYIDSSFVIQQRPLAEVSAALKDYRRIKGCNSLYFRFSNQKGGYSNWLFEAYGETESGGSEGAFVRNNQVDDFGGDAENIINIYSKVPAEYVGLIRDLIVSPEIYVYKESEFVRVTSLKNSLEQDNSKRAYTVRLKYDMNYRFNPELLW